MAYSPLLTYTNTPKTNKFINQEFTGIIYKMQTNSYCSAESMSRDISKAKNLVDHLGQVNY